MGKAVLKEVLILFGSFLILLIITAGILPDRIGDTASILILFIGLILVIIRFLKKTIALIKKRAKKPYNKKEEKSVLETNEIITKPSQIEKKRDLVKKDVFNRFQLHEDLQGLIWIFDGPNKNYDSYKDKETFKYEFGGSEFLIMFSYSEEPSLIYTKMPIKETDDIFSIERPPYFPKFNELSPEQKWVYVNLLSNPYDSRFDIGFVFILYYGLERHLFLGNFEKAFSVILKLRDIFSNSSFQYYSANALILSAMLKKRGEFVTEFISSLDKDYEFNFSDNLFLLCYYSFDIPVLSKDIMRMAKTFGWTNTNYIKKQTEVFIEVLDSVIASRNNGERSILLKNIITQEDLAKVRSEKTQIFANMSIIDEAILVPQLAKLTKLKRELYSLLEEAHNTTKIKLAELRKVAKV